MVDSLCFYRQDARPSHASTKRQGLFLGDPPECPRSPQHHSRPAWSPSCEQLWTLLRIRCRKRAGVPVDVDQWGWRCGFYPGLDPGQNHDGSAANFELARVAFEEAWRRLLPKIPEGAFTEYRRDRA
jgi:hypothetical protein